MADTPASFQNWYDASQQLAESIQRYLDASQALEAAVTCRSEASQTTSALDKLFATVRPELVSRSSRDDKIRKSDAALCRVYNQSTKFVPVQRLPCELLVRIFFLACQRCGFFPSSQRKISNCQTTKTMLAITHVCSDWRRLAVNTPILWSHVDMLDTSNHYPKPGHEKAWLERARSVTLSVQAHIGTDSKKLLLLGPYFGAIRSLGFESESHDELGAAIAHWTSNGTPGLVQELSLMAPKERNRFGNPPRVDKMIGRSLFESFVAPLKVLRLRQVEFATFVCCEELVHLELSYIGSITHSPESLIGCWLSKCPELRVLKLDSLVLAGQNVNWNLAVRLDKLERLEIIDVSPDQCFRLLPMLAPGAGELSLRLETRVGSWNEDKLVSFLNRSNVTKLYFKVPLGDSVQMDWIAAVPNLQMLVLDFHGESDSKFRNSVLETLLPSETSTPRFPKLRTLWVIDFNYFDVEVLERVIKTCRIETLIISVFQYLDTRSLRKQLGPLLKKLIMEAALPHSVIAEWYSRAN
ncbi:hypothetical protein FRC10_000423 [Ceratobasidium sp. 414]|nr:hypothetical protein FRC10_000423 [Ceratobasidium sp. 414]